jgi:thymidylate synthase ThyX
MSYGVQVVADSIAPNESRITTMRLKYPRMIHSEFMTHRAFSRNASSTRAIPMRRLIEWVEEDPEEPVFWGKNRAGMQATQELGGDDLDDAKNEWHYAKQAAVDHAKELAHLGVHKQIVGRLLEPFAHINVVVTGTAPAYMNFFAQRCHKDAMPEMQVLAVKMARAYRESCPREIETGELHLPFITEEEWFRFGRCDLIKCSVARCARVSYLTHERKAPDMESDIALHDRLLESGHWSPFEHQAEAQAPDLCVPSGNLMGWWQYRQLLDVSVYTEFDFDKLDTDYKDRDFIV